jgi:hypothetical protein
MLDTPAMLHFPFSAQVMEHLLSGHFVVLEPALALFLSSLEFRAQYDVKGLVRVEFRVGSIVP